MPKFRKKPVEIEAWRVNQQGDPPPPEWLTSARNVHFVDDADPGNHGYIVIGTLEGDMRADVGDWIIKGTAGELYPCRHGIFETCYEPVP